MQGDIADLKLFRKNPKIQWNISVTEWFIMEYKEIHLSDYITIYIVVKTKHTGLPVN